MAQVSSFILHVLISQAFGGLELYVCQLIEQLLAGGESIIAFVYAGSEVDTYLSALPHIILVRTQEMGRLNRQNIKQLRRILRSYPIQAIHTHQSKDLWITSVANTPKRYGQIHSIYMNVPLAKKDILSRYIYSKIDAVCSTADYTNRNIAKYLPVKPNKIHLMPYGREVEKYTLDDTKREEIRGAIGRKTNDKIVVGTLSRIDVLKGIREFVASYPLLKQDVKTQVEYWVIGEPSIAETLPDGTVVYEESGRELHEWIEHFTKENGLETKIIRRGFQKEYLPVLGSMDIFVLPSYGEMYSLSVLDAMLMNVPVIGTDRSGTTEQLTDGRGLLIEPHSPQAIAEAVETYAEHPELRRSSAANASQWVRLKHQWTTTIEQHKRLYYHAYTATSGK
ncbi:MAG: glycosyltransferase family 4 protein [Candidatus Kapaibacterium sp.]